MKVTQGPCSLTDLEQLSFQAHDLAHVPRGHMPWEPSSRTVAWLCCSQASWSDPERHATHSHMLDNVIDVRGAVVRLSHSSNAGSGGTLG